MSSKMTVSEALEKISRALAVLALQTRAENLAGQYSKNRLVEDLLLPVFRLALQAPTLRNLNKAGVNSPHIDLADDQARLAIQVTTDRTPGKLTGTLRGFISDGYQKRYDRLVFFILTENKPRYVPKTKRQWKRICGRRLHFDPTSDIVTTLDLVALIQALPHREIFALHDIIAQSVIGEAYVDIESYLTRLSRRQLDYEKNTGRYIPDIFVETYETKNLARSFAHPVLFFRRTLESLGRLSIPYWNDLLAKAGLPPLPFPDLTPYRSTETLSDVCAAATELSVKFDEVRNVLAKYEEEPRKGTPPFPVKEDRKHYYDENVCTLQMNLGWGLKRKLGDLLNELAVVKARVFILTGRAGQGKTNLVCDFVENFLWKHGIPCAYLTGQKLRLMQTPDLGDAIQRSIFEEKTSSFAEAARLLSKHADRINKPFILIVDGLNEHHRIGEFAEQLQHFIQTAIEYPHLRFFLTCRSEFFDQRFGRLTTSPLKPRIFLLPANERRLEEECYDEMLAGYFKFFGVQRDRVSDQVIETLKKDILLLRFFCEAYGAKGKPDQYRQPFLNKIYRAEIFEIYLKQKLGMANAFLQLVTGKMNVTGKNADLLAVLKHCIQHMLQVWQFGNVPVSAVPGSLSYALDALLEEELILRRDAPPGRSVFSPSEETINFTFDEFRDFLIAQYLLWVYVDDLPTFEQYIARTNPKDSQIIEGVKKFLFYESREPQNADFWEFYRSKPWYQDVYDQEVFNIDEKLLRTEDRDLIVEALRAGGDRARIFARQLAVRWHPGRHPLLNLDLFLALTTQADDMQFDNLIVGTFKLITYFNEGTCASAFCKVATRDVLPKFKPSSNAPENGLFRFLILLLPVDSGIDLDSESYRSLRQLLNKYPTYAVSLLRESLEYTPTRHRPFVWRLLSSVKTDVVLDDSWRSLAEKERARAFETDSVLCREVSRFLDHIGQVVASQTL